MEQRRFARIGRSVGVMGLGAWQLGADWGEVNENDALATVNAAIDSGVTLIDTADVYGDGRSERLIGQVLAERNDVDLFVATKMGRRVSQEAANYNADNFREWTDRSRKNLGVEVLDLVQLHCPPTAVFAEDQVFDALDQLVADEVIRNYGVSVETVDQGLTAIRRPGVASVQVIFNAFRLKPMEQLLPAAQEAGVGILARVPLASGLLSGKYSTETQFDSTDHRNFNRHGEAFDVGETFAGVDFETGLKAVETLRPLVPESTTMAQWALRWVTMNPAVTAVIPGARNPAQAKANADAALLPELSADDLAVVADVYDQYIKPQVHDRW